jgi:hypothetical protein
LSQQQPTACNNNRCCNYDKTNSPPRTPTNTPPHKPPQAGIAPELHEAEPNCLGGDGTNLATFRGRCAAGTLEMSGPVTSFLLGKSVEQDVDDLVCLGNECDPPRLNAGVMAILIIAGVLAGMLVLLYAYQNGDSWARACMANSLVARLLYPCACLFRRDRAKESPATTDHEIHMKGMLA